MTDHVTELTLQIDAPDIDANELDDLARLLQDEIEQLDVESVEQQLKGPPPEGALAVDWILVGTIAVKLSPIIIPPLIGALKSWIDRQTEGSKETGLKININWGTFSVAVDRTTSRQEAVNLGKELEEKAEAEQET